MRTYRSGWNRNHRRFLHPLARQFPPLRAETQEIHRFVIEDFARIGVPQSIADKTPGHAWPEVILVVEAMDSAHDVFARKAREREMRELVAAVVGDRFAVEVAGIRATV